MTVPACWPTPSVRVPVSGHPIPSYTSPRRGSAPLSAKRGEGSGVKPPNLIHAPASSTASRSSAATRRCQDPAGGQSLVPLLNFRLSRPAALIDLNRIPSLAYIRSHDGEVRLGAMTRQRTVEFSPVIAERVPLLTEATRWVGHLPIRSRGTIGGSLAHADPSAEYPTVLAALEGSVVARGPKGERVVARRLSELPDDDPPRRDSRGMRVPASPPVGLTLESGAAATAFRRRRDRGGDRPSGDQLQLAHCTSGTARAHPPRAEPSDPKRDGLGDAATRQRRPGPSDCSSPATPTRRAYLAPLTCPTGAAISARSRRPLLIATRRRPSS